MERSPRSYRADLRGGAHPEGHVIDRDIRPKAMWVRFPIPFASHHYATADSTWLQASRLNKGWMKSRRATLNVGVRFIRDAGYLHVRDFPTRSHVVFAVVAVIRPPGAGVPGRTHHPADAPHRTSRGRCGDRRSAAVA